MTTLALTPASIDGLEISANDRDLLRDLFTYIDYVQVRDVKRMVRSNELPKADSARIARLLGDPEIEQAVKETGGAAWIDFIDHLALSMKLVKYDTKGEYRGYTSSEPSYIDNYIQVDKGAYQAFLDLAPIEQELKLLYRLLTPGGRDEYSSAPNEFFRQSVLGWLDPFDRAGSATGVMPLLDFVSIRRFLLELLQQCQPGVWYSTASLVDFLKVRHPYFLIPKTIKADKWGKTVERYYNFRDGPERWSRWDAHIPTDAPDAFERVEGRYIERFLEGIPLTMRFVEVAYLREQERTVYPSIGWLRAFRVSERFLRLMAGDALPPRVTVQPNFDVIVESELYPARLMQTLYALAEEVSAPGGSTHAAVVTLQLKKERIAAELVRNPDLDVIGLLQELTGRELPPNVAIELEEWSGHADQFTLYTGFSLLESVKRLPQADPFTVERLSKHFRLVKQTDALVDTLEEALLAPVVIRHGLRRFEPLPETARTIFPKKTKQSEAPRGPQQVLLPRVVMMTYTFPDAAIFDDFRKALAELRCPIQADPAMLSITFPQQEQPRFDEALQQLAGKYRVEIEDRIG
ncbi:MAG: hypothetical protein JXB07_08410 [Anaerolineae bacterium]|nr:hypothetical protein [Anaerolineae bacterium]